MVTKGIVLTHGAGSDANSPLLIAAEGAFAAIGYTVRRYTLPFRQQRKTGPPNPAGAANDRAGLRDAIRSLQSSVDIVLAGGHSYGGRQASILAAGEPRLLPALLLLAYPLHPPAKPHQLRTEHFPRLTTPALFVHGDKDPFGAPHELKLWVNPPHELQIIAGAGHDLKGGKIDWAPLVLHFDALATRTAARP